MLSKFGDVAEADGPRIFIFFLCKNKIFGRNRYNYINDSKILL